MIKEFYRYPSLSPEELDIRQPWWHKEEPATVDLADSDEDFMDDNEWQGSIENSVLVEAVSEVTELVAELLEEFVFSFDSELELMI